MSGGPYGRGKALERECMKVGDWPVADRALWQKACAAADPFDPEAGMRSRYRHHTNRKVEKGYGRWLTFLTGSGLLDVDAAPSERITKPLIIDYVQSLQEIGNGSNTILARLQEIGDFAVAVDPTFDRRETNAIASRVRANHRVVRDPRQQFVPTNELLSLGLSLMETAPQCSTPRREAMAFRDGLFIALLAMRALRRRNIAGLELGKSIIKLGAKWMLRIPATEMKQGKAIEEDVPAFLFDSIEIYLDRHRPLLATMQARWKSHIGDAFWVSSSGSPMTQMAMYNQVRTRAKDAFGKALGLHSFRHALATTMAIEDPEHVRMASTILGHSSQRTTEKYYQLAETLEAHRSFAHAVSSRRRRADSEP